MKSFTSVVVLLSCVPLAVCAASHPVVEETGAALHDRRGLVVWLGAGDGESAVNLARSVDCVLHGLETNSAAADKAGQAVLKAGLCGRAWVECLGPKLDPLPYNSLIANVVIVDDFVRAKAAGLMPAEVARIAARTGLIIVGQDARHGRQVDAKEMKEWLIGQGLEHVREIDRDGRWEVFRKPDGPQTEEFSHKWKSATRNLASDDDRIQVPNTVRWMNACPGNAGELRTADRRVVMYNRKIPPGPQAENTLTCFDAFSGVKQWESVFPVASNFVPWIFTSNRIVLASGEGLVSIDADTGKQRFAYKDIGTPEEIVAADGVLLCIEPYLIRGLDLETGAPLWTLPSKTPKPEKMSRGKGWKPLSTGFATYSVAAAEGKAFVLEFFMDSPTNPVAKLMGVDLRTGVPAWTRDCPSLVQGYRKYFYYRGRLIYSTPTAVVSIPADVQGEQWKQDAFTWDRATSNVTAQLGGDQRGVWGAGGMVWTRIGEHFRGRNAIIDPVEKEMPYKIWIGMDSATGKEKTRMGYEIGDGSWQQRCYPDAGTPNFIYSSNSEYVDLKKREISSWRVMRGVCGEGVLFGSGGMYVSPSFCYWCYPMIRGAIAVGVAPERRMAVADERRLERGPAYGVYGNAPKVDAADWPMFRHDMKRTGGTTATAGWPLKPVKGWPKQFASRVHAPLVVGDRLYVTSINEGRIVAFDPEGKELWAYAAGSRIDLPPTLHGALLLFGCHDGRVHAIRASDGALAWRLNIAPEIRRMLADDAVESPWPVMGSVLIVDGIGYVCGGRITGLDGGLCLAAFDAITGEVKWTRQVGRVYEKKLKTGATNNPDGYWKKPYGPTEGQMTSSILVHAGGDELRLYEQDFVWRFNRKDGSFILVDSGTGYPHSDYSANLPFHTFGRVDMAGVMAGRTVAGQFLIRGGMVLSFPEPTGYGLVFASAEKLGYQLMGCRPEGVRWVRGYENKDGGIAPAWGRSVATWKSLPPALSVTRDSSQADR